MDRSTTEKKGKGKKDTTKYHCPDGKLKTFCDLCGGNSLCEHKANKYCCAKCNKGERIRGWTKYNCPHGKKKNFCLLCDDSALCKTPHCPTAKNSKYDGCCWYCFANLFPDTPVVHNYQTKENTIATFLKEMGSRIVIVEVDENSHDVYNPTCEEKRMGEIWEDLGHRPLVFVRFNPDRYKDELGRNVPSPWGGKRANGVATLSKKWKAAWEARLEILRETVEE